MQTIIQCFLINFYLFLPTFGFSTESDNTISQLFIIADYGDEELLVLEEAGTTLSEHTQQIDTLVSTQKIGGILFKGRWTPSSLKQRIQHLSSISLSPLLFAQDMEWGLQMRHDGFFDFPKNLTIAATNDHKLLSEWATALATSAKAIGINFFLGPVIDVNSNPHNPIIHDRSFGDDPEKVAKNGAIVLDAFQKSGVIPCAKHFPGHGNTDKDSHTDLPVLYSTREDLDICELLPFKRAIAKKVPSIMTAHIALPQTQSKQTPASLSSYWIEDVLRKELKFTGAVVSDDLIMVGALHNKTPAQAAIQALLAGSDLLILSREIEKTIAYIENEQIPTPVIGRHISRIENLKKSIPSQTPDPLNYHKLLKLRDKLYTKALTQVGSIPPLTPETHIIHVGSCPLNSLSQSILSKYPSIQISQMRDIPRKEEVLAITESLSSNALVILSNLSRSPRENFNLSPSLQNAFARIQEKCSLTYIILGSPYLLNHLSAHSALVTYENNEITQQAVFKALQGKIRPKGQLPITALSFP